MYLQVPIVSHWPSGTKSPAPGSCMLSVSCLQICDCISSDRVISPPPPPPGCQQTTLPRSFLLQAKCTQPERVSIQDRLLETHCAAPKAKHVREQASRAVCLLSEESPLVRTLSARSLPKTFRNREPDGITQEHVSREEWYRKARRSQLSLPVNQPLHTTPLHQSTNLFGR